MFNKLHNIAIKATKTARDAILEYYHHDLDITYKVDGSPLTLAEKIAQEIIFLHLMPTGLPIVAEEKTDLHIDADMYWLVDPLDGTKDFLAGNDEFTVNISLVVHNSPKLGVVYAPTLNELYAGNKGNDDWYEKGGIRNKCTHLRKKNKCRIAVSRFHDHRDIDLFCSDNGISERVAIGSALKYGRLAIGNIEVITRRVGSSERDTAAGQAVLEAAGGAMIDWHTGAPFLYGKKGRRNPRFLAFRTPYVFSDFKLRHYKSELL